MSLRTRLNDDMKNAMRAKDTAKLGTIRLLTAAMKQKEVDERVETRVEVLLVALLACPHRLVVELVERLGVAFGEFVLTFRGDPDDHGACPWDGPACSACAGSPAVPINQFRHWNDGLSLRGDRITEDGLHSSLANNAVF